MPTLPFRRLCAVLSALCLALGAVVLPPAPSAQAETLIGAEAAKRKINLAGRQRMLSQRMAMLACMADSDVQTENALARAEAAHGLFDRTLRGLRFGDEELGLPVETRPEVLDSLALVDELWGGYGQAVSLYVDRGRSATLRAIHARNPAVLAKMNASVGVMERLYGEGLIAPELATALNIAGRQRMLIMKALKEACMVGRGIAPEEDRKALLSTVALFSSSLYKLRAGNAWDGIIPPPTFEVDMQLELVQAIWDWMDPILREIAEGGPVETEQLSRLLYHGEVALREMNQAVTLYESG
ncbi:type IV pili methyl-accepting chemotaxis transducer N-terminal domain-containing protein [Pseudooceanicola marinus]|uniref:type IV pili methyl-accepting chemotaxis transducer N-terminal domain-containing protein n=1 Tax=Pseudooceanicola marinus TaxID=396013 RepID=UPI001CD1F716|nr:type IV pili methyl-accepting chemotaxis transducer N-terminal domain-containing protein [Pseudooceanicola marinus]MCA1334780.1 type IV pili methyl-accepting chemotaxis transducer N-terminal domain-containing protein [Pseudooceanicola marinus]